MWQSEYLGFDLLAKSLSLHCWASVSHQILLWPQGRAAAFYWLTFYGLSFLVHLIGSILGVLFFVKTTAKGCALFWSLIMLPYELRLWKMHRASWIVASSDLLVNVIAQETGTCILRTFLKSLLRENGKRKVNKRKTIKHLEWPWIQRLYVLCKLIVSAWK